MPPIPAALKLAVQHHQSGNLDHAEQLYRQVLDTQPDQHDAWHLLGVLMNQRGQPATAMELIGRAIAMNGSQASYHYNLGVILGEQGRLDEAMNSYRRAISLHSRYAEAHSNLAGAYYVLGQLAQAEYHYRAAAESHPQRVQFRANLGAVLLDEGKFEEALACYEGAMTLEPRDGLRVRCGLALPLIPSSVDEVHSARRRFEQNVVRLLDQPLQLEDPPRDVASTPFYLAYHGLNNRQLQCEIANLYTRAAPVLSFVAPHCNALRHQDGASRPLRIGFLSKYFFSHAVSQHFGGLIEGMSRLFQVLLFRFPWPNDEVVRSLGSHAAKVVTLQPQLTVAQRQVADEELDVLVYPDIGMDPLTYFLAYSRLAPVQCVLPGHPDTTGIPTIDYFLSSEALEPADADDHYSERLVRFRNLLTCIERPTIAGPIKSRRDFGIADDTHIYLCAQTLFKIHPEFDGLLGRILHSDPQGQVVIVEGHQAHWTRLLKDRLARELGSEMARVQFLPRQYIDDFRQLLALADVVLDTTHFNGGTTTFETLALGTPIVTLPGPLMRGRQTYAAYRTIGVLDCVAHDCDDYVRLAVRLGADAAWRDEIRAKILAANQALFGNRGIVDELAQFFHEASRGAGQGTV